MQDLFLVNLAKLKELQPDGADRAELAQGECFDMGLYFHIPEAYRPQNLQERYFLQGRTKPEDFQRDFYKGKITLADYKRGLQLLQERGPVFGRVVTWTLSSRHTARRALDIYPVDKGGITITDEKKQLAALDRIEEVVRKYGLFRPQATYHQGDYVHFELAESWPMPPAMKVRLYTRRVRRAVDPHVRQLYLRVLGRLLKRLPAARSLSAFVVRLRKRSPI